MVVYRPVMRPELPAFDVTPSRAWRRMRWWLGFEVDGTVSDGLKLFREPHAKTLPYVLYKASRNPLEFHVRWH